MNFCPACGARASQAHFFCAECGNRVQDSYAPVAPSSVGYPPPRDARPPAGNKPAIVAAVLMGAAVAVVIGFAVTMMSEPHTPTIDLQPAVAGYISPGAAVTHTVLVPTGRTAELYVRPSGGFDVVLTVYDPSMGVQRIDPELAGGTEYYSLTNQGVEEVRVVIEISGFNDHSGSYRVGFVDATTSFDGRQR